MNGSPEFNPGFLSIRCPLAFRHVRQLAYEFFRGYHVRSR